MARERTRAKDIVDRLRAAPETSDEVFTAFEELDSLPPDVVREALEPWLGVPPDIELLDDATRLAHGLPSRRPRLVTLEVTRDADVLFLGSVAEAQLRLAGHSWDGVDREPEERLDGEVDGSFAGTLERVVLGDDANEKTPCFDVIRFRGDSGVVFRAGTVQRIGFIADGRVEVADANLRAALTDALAALTERPAEEVVAEAVPKTKRAAATKKKTTSAKKKTSTAAKKKTTKKTSTDE